MDDSCRDQFAEHQLPLATTEKPRRSADRHVANHVTRGKHPPDVRYIPCSMGAKVSGGRKRSRQAQGMEYIRRHNRNGATDIATRRVESQHKMPPWKTAPQQTSSNNMLFPPNFHLNMAIAVDVVQLQLRASPSDGFHGTLVHTSMFGFHRLPCYYSRARPT